MTEAFRSPPPSPNYPGQAATRQDVTDTVRRIMGEDIAPPQDPPDVPTPGTPGGPAQSSTTEVAKDQAGQVADTAKQAGAQVAGTVKEQAVQVTAEAKNQAKQLLAQAQSELSEQAASTQQRVSDGLHALADELAGMARNSDQDGVATDLARQAADKARSAAGWLADRDPGSLLDEVRSFARNKPGTYLALALGAGVVAGRLTRGLTAPTDNDATPEARSTAITSTPPALVVGRPTLLGADTPATAPVYDQFPPTGLGTIGAVGTRGDVTR